MARAERFLPLALLLTLATPAWGHGLDSRQGAVVVRSDRVEVTLEAEVGAEQAVLAELVLRDEVGAKLRGRVASVQAGNEPDHLLLVLEYPLERPPRWLSFRLGEDGRAAWRPRRLVLSVRDRSSPEPQLVTLTNGGNVETLRFGGREPMPECGPALLDRHPDRLREVTGLWRRESWGARLDVVFPLGVLESWLPVPRADPDFIGVAEQRAARAVVTDLVATRVRVVGDGGAQVSPSAGEVTFLGLDDGALGPAPEPRRLDSWTARVRVSLRFDRPGRLDWQLWNARVTIARLVVLDEEGCAERRLSTYDPRL
jgi:hypothetical protein